jgi:hypothetical protein
MLAGATAAMASTGAPAVNVAASPTISVTPSTGLTDGAVTQVAASGLTANGSYHVGECTLVSGQPVCDTADHVDLNADGNGNLSTPLTVRSSFTAPTTNGGTTTVDCTTASCVVGIFDDSFNDVGSVPISFGG